eukprot:scaffold375_cov299-Chaetoceros_neogracile.AAC.3
MDPMTSRNAFVRVGGMKELWILIYRGTNYMAPGRKRPTSLLHAKPVQALYLLVHGSMPTVLMSD